MKKEKEFLHISRLIANELTRSITSEERKYLDQWLNESIENKNIYQKIKADNWYATHLESIQEFNVEEGWNRMNSRIPSNSKVIKLRTNMFKYAVAASILLITALTIFLNKDDNMRITEPVIVNSVIEPGTDKAILTLGDGSQIALEKGESFQTQNANSNGEEIIYEAGKRNTLEVAYNYLTIPRGGQFFVKLSDGTQVWLNSESQLKYPVAFIEGEIRQVELVYGEAYFDVSPSTAHKGAKFKVQNNVQEVEVLGTEFNIKAYRDEANVYTTLVEGKVVVSALNKTKILMPNEQLNLNLSNKSILSSSVDVYRVISWKEGVFSFKNKPLKDMMKVISRWYDIKVVFANETLKDITFNGSLDKKLSIEEVLSIIAGSNNISYEINNKTIIFK